MRNASRLLAALVVMAMVAAVSSTAGAAEGDKPAGKPALLHGHIKKIDGKSFVVAIGKGDNEKDVTVVTDRKHPFQRRPSPGEAGRPQGRRTRRRGAD